MMATAAVVFALAIPRLIEFGAADILYARADGGATDVAIGMLWAALIAISIPLWPVRRSMRMALLWAWLLRISLIFLVSMPYFHHYSFLDLFWYFDCRTIVPNWSNLGFGHGTENLIALVWMLARVVPDSFTALNVSFAAIALIGMYWFWMASESFLGYPSRAIFYLLMAEPSLMFWTGMIGKEAIMILALGLYVYAVVAWWRTGCLRPLMQVAIGVFLAGLIRTWLAGIMLGSMVVLFYAAAQGIRTRVIITLAIVVAVRAALPFFLQMFALQAEQDLTEQVADISGGFHGGGSAGVAFALYGPLDLITNAPWGMFSALFRPLPGDVLNPFGLVASGESALMLVLLLRALKRIRLRDFLDDPLVTWALALVLLWALIYAFVSSQNFGTAVRYRVQILPMLLGLLLYLGRARTRGLPHKLESEHA